MADVQIPIAATHIPINSHRRRMAAVSFVVALVVGMATEIVKDIARHAADDWIEGYAAGAAAKNEYWAKWSRGMLAKCDTTR